MNPLVAPELLWALLIAALLVTLGMLGTLVVQRSSRRARERRRRELDGRLRRLVLEATIADDDELPALLDRMRALDRGEHAHIGRTVFMMLQDVTGEAADRLRAVAAAVGLAPLVLDAARHRSAVRRADAAEALGRLAPEGALELLLELADDRDPEVRTVAVRALGSFEDPVAVDAVTRALATESGVPSTVAATALLQQGSAASERVRQALRDPDAGIRRGAARIAGLLQVPGAGEELVRLVQDEHESVRLAAMRSLERLPVRDALDPLVEQALAGGTKGEAAARTIAAMPSAWRGEALRALDRAEPGVRRAAGLPRREALA